MEQVSAWPGPELHAIFFAIWAGSSCEEISTQFGLIWSQFGSQRNFENVLTSISARPVRDLPPPLVLELALACIPYFSEMQELWRLTNDLPAYLTTAAAWLSNVEIDRNDMADYTEKVLLFWRSNAPKFPAWGRLACAFALDGTLLYRRRAHIFALQPHVRRRRPS